MTATLVVERAVFHSLMSITARLQSGRSALMSLFVRVIFRLWRRWSERQSCCPPSWIFCRQIGWSDKARTSGAVAAG